MAHEQLIFLTVDGEHCRSGLAMHAGVVVRLTGVLSSILSRGTVYDEVTLTADLQSGGGHHHTVRSGRMNARPGRAITYGIYNSRSGHAQAFRHVFPSPKSRAKVGQRSIEDACSEHPSRDIRLEKC